MTVYVYPRYHRWKLEPPYGTGIRFVGGESHELLLSDVSALLEEPLSAGG
jgi:hypothetical protein